MKEYTERAKKRWRKCACQGAELFLWRKQELLEGTEIIQIQFNPNRPKKCHLKFKCI